MKIIWRLEIVIIKLAEALLDRSELQKKIADIQARMRENAIIQQDDVPTEDPSKLFEELKQAYKSFDDLNRRINTTNNSTFFNDKMKICDALYQREALDRQIKELASLASAFASKSTRYSKTEIKYISTMDPKALRSHVDDLKRQRKELDRQVQSLNWSIDLLP